jgi:YD repeat-containing protein
VYNTRDWSILTAYDVEEPVNVINLDQDGKVILFGLGNGNITSVTATGPQRRKTYNVYPQSKYGQVDVVAVAGSPDGKFLLAGGSAGYMTIEDASRETAADRQIQKIPVRVIRADDGQVVASFNELSEVEQAEWDPKGRYVALVDYARHLCIWTPILPKQGYACIILPGVGFTLSISPDGGQIAAIADQDVLIFNIK